MNLRGSGPWEHPGKGHGRCALPRAIWSTTWRVIRQQGSIHIEDALPFPGTSPGVSRFIYNGYLSDYIIARTGATARRYGRNVKSLYRAILAQEVPVPVSPCRIGSYMGAARCKKVL